METKDKRILIFTSGAFLIVLAFILFFTMQSKDNMISNAGRYKGVDKILPEASSDSSRCSRWNFDTVVSDELVKTRRFSNDVEIVNGNGNAYQITIEPVTGYNCEELEPNLQTCYREIKKTGKCIECKDDYALNSSDGKCYDKAVLKCYNVEYDGTEQVIAECKDGCYIDTVNGKSFDQLTHVETDVNDYSVVAKTEGGALFSNGTTSDTCNGTISCPSDKPNWNDETKECESSGSSSNKFCYYYSSIGNFCRLDQIDDGTTCEEHSTESVPVYSTMEDCEKNITCKADEYVVTGPTRWQCNTCPSGAHLKSANCHGTEDECCENTSNPTTVTCAPGKYLPGQSTSCATCPAGYSCPGGTYRSGDSSPSGLNQCTENTYASGGASACSTCTGTIQKSGSLNVGCTATTGCNPGEYKIKKDDGSFNCETCPNGYIATVDIPYCHIVIPAGSYLVGGTSEIISCPVNTYSEGGIYRSSGSSSDSMCLSGDCTIDRCHACPSGTSPIGSTSVNACKPSTGICTIKATTEASRVSYGDAFNVSVSVNGDGCNGRTMIVNATRGTTTSNSYNISNGQSFNFIVTASEQSTCTSSVIFKATAGDASGSVTVDTIRNWYLEKEDACVTDSDYNSTSHSLSEADAKPEDVYYILKGDNTCGNGSKKVDIYRRGCGSTSTLPPTKYCCVNKASDGNTYKSDQTSCTGDWKVFTGECKEVKACYSHSGSYVYGDYRGREQEGYAQVDDSKCTSTPTPTTYCCVNKASDGNHYNPNQTSCTGDWEVYNGECKEVKACYTYSGGYIYGDYSGREGYKYYGTECPKEACYIFPDGTYHFTDNPPYGSSIVSSVSEAEDCKPDIVTPPSNPVTPVTKYVCYVNNSKTIYRWYKECSTGEYFDGTSCKTGTNSSTNPDDVYSADISINNGTSCIPPEAPACYLNRSTNDYEWGLYKNKVGYSEADESKCNWCYEDRNGKYVWGRHINDSNYKKVDSSKCATIPVPKTDLNVSTIIYISIAILSMFGIGFVYYANKKKKI